MSQQLSSKPGNHPLRTIIIAAGLIAVTFGVTTLYATPDNNPNNQNITHEKALNEQTPRIQIAILLDTSGSMDGLIEQAKNQLWKVVNEFAKARKDSLSPLLEVAVYEYGNDGLPAENGYIRQVIGLTHDLDKVSEALFSLRTNGGNEYCGYVIDTAVKNLQWSDSDQDIKAIFIAGNEPFSQGPVPFKNAITSARTKGIVVNTIHAGGYDKGAQTGWRDGAVLAGGEYMNIDHNHRIVHIEAPQDGEIAELNNRLNETYIPYGARGKESQKRQKLQDTNSQEISAGLMSQRTQAKASSMYDNSGWDLVDGIRNKTIKLEELKPSALPEEMRRMSIEQRYVYIQKKASERKEIQNRILKLTDARNKYIVEKKRETSEADVSTLDDAITKAVRKQGEKKSFAFSNN
jgi:hypothetical protein